MFDDILRANAEYAKTFTLDGLEGTAARGLGVITCIDTRIEPLQMLGLVPGDAKILRNAGARITDDVLRSLVLAVNLLGVDRVCIVQHTDCGVYDTTNEELRSTIAKQQGVDASAWDFLPIDDHARILREDIARIRACPLLPGDLPVHGYVYDVHTGLLTDLTDEATGT